MTDVPAKNRLATRRRLAFTLFLAFWSLMLISGFFDLIERHVPNYPNSVAGFPNIGQEGLFVIPSAFVLLNILLLAFSSKFPRLLVAAILAVQLILLLAFLALSGGGI